MDESENLDEFEEYVWLKTNSSPSDIVKTKWENTFDIRRKEILADEPIIIFEKWPILQFPVAADLVSFFAFNLRFNS